MMCAFHDSNCNGFGDMWWTDKCTYFSSILSMVLVWFHTMHTCSMKTIQFMRSVG